MALHLPIGPLKTRSGLEPVPRCEPGNYQPMTATAPSGPIWISDVVYTFIREKNNGLLTGFDLKATVLVRTYTTWI